jgi:hypothetical protein
MIRATHHLTNPDDFRDTSVSHPAGTLPPEPFGSTDNIWFWWTMGRDVDPSGPTADELFGVDPKHGAYLCIVRPLPPRSRDVAFSHIPDWAVGQVGHGVFDTKSLPGPCISP